MPEGLAGIPAWVLWLVGGGGLTALAGSVLVFVATRRRDNDAALAGRFDDASELAKYIREEVERQVAPIRAELTKVKNESHEMHDAVRAHFTQLWMWDHRGRVGPLPLLPTQILNRLGLTHLLDDDWPTEPPHTKP
ncbi:MAG: hypothetical protein K0S70_3955 [Microbacterium sp.]|jgi:hypothetical protein|nr:hypothetical protein [Microbacterium sp.]